MRLSPIIRKLLRPFLSRFFTKSLATASCTFTAAVFSFTLLPVVHAEDTDVEEPKITDHVKDILEVWHGLDNFNVFDMTKQIEGVDSVDGVYISNSSSGVRTGDLFWIWKEDDYGNYNFKLCESEEQLQKLRDEGYAGESINVKYKSLYDLNNNSKWGNAYDFIYDFDKDDGAKFEHNLNHSSNQEAPDHQYKDTSDIYIIGNGEVAQRNDNVWNEDGKRFTPEKWVPQVGAYDAVIIQGKEYKFDTQYVRDLAQNKLAAKDKHPMYYEAGSGANRGVGGGAMFFTNVDEKGRPKDSSDSYEIVVDFIGNGLRGTDNQRLENEYKTDLFDNGASRVSNPHGGAIYTSLGVDIKHIKGNFVSNYIITNSKGYGGAIYNMGTIGEIEANFLFNYVLSTNDGGNAANAGAICNGKESSSADPVGGDITSIKGYFIGNYVLNQAEKRDTLGGAIINYGHIGSLDGVFIGNYNKSLQTANSGVIRNYAQNHWLATIGDEIKIDPETGKPSNLHPDDTVFNGIFIGNYSEGKKGDAFAGVMRNNGNINGRIEGLYIGNYAKTDGTEVTAKTNPDGQSDGQVGAYNYLKWSSANQQYVIGNSGMAYGGVFYNDIKLEDNQASGKPYIGNIKATFVDNYAFSTYGEAFGGAIFNQDAEIQDIDSDFQGNYSKSEYFIARAGALYNDTNEAGKNHSTKDEEGNEIKEPYIGTIKQIGKFEGGKIDRFAIFSKNYAQGKMAQGGAVYVSNDSTIEEVAAKFSGNIVRSKVSPGDSDFYYHLQDTVEGNKALFDPEKLVSKGILTPTAQGGALYVADGGSTQEIVATFTGNYAETNGVGEQMKEGYVDKNGYRVTREEVTIEAGDGTEPGGDEGTEPGGEIVTEPEGEVAVEPTYIFKDRNGNVLNEEDVETVTISMNEVQTAQGGAIYVARRAEELRDQTNKDSDANIQNITAEFTGNSVVNKGKTSLRQVRSVAQGGAVYVSDKGKVLNIDGNFTENAATGMSIGSEEELVEGGAIYVSAGGEIKEIGSEEGGRGYTFTSNKVTASGQGIQLVKQDARGGAIYVSSGDGAPGTIDNIHADFIDNQVVAEAGDNDTEPLAETKASRKANRLVQGGAIFVSDEATIGRITMNGDGFVGNKIMVNGSIEGATSELKAQGGAIYVATKGNTQSINANFIGNTVESKASGNSLEAVGGGAIFIQEEGFVKNIGHIEKVGDKVVKNAMKFADNAIKADGKDSGTLTEQKGRGGAIFVSSRPNVEKAPESEGYSIHNITADFTQNSIELSGTDAYNNSLEQRLARGGALFVDEEGSIATMTQGDAEITDKDGKKLENGFYGNHITIRGGNADNSTLLKAQGGAVYVSTSSKVDSIEANFIENYIDTVDASGNETERAGGGAIYVDNMAEVGSIDKDGVKLGIGTETNRVEIRGNYIKVGGKGAKLVTQYARGGAIFVGVPELGTAANPDEAGTIQSVYAKITKNGLIADAADDTKVETRNIRGGAIFLADNGRINYLNAGEDGHGLEENYIKVTGGNAEKGTAELYAGGGAMYVSRDGGATGVMAGFEGNYVDISKSTGNKAEYARGGAIFLDKGGRIDQIGEENEGVVIRNNHIIVSGNGANLEKQEVQGGALYVSALENSQTTGETQTKANDTETIRAIYADVKENFIQAKASKSTKLTDRTLQGGAIYLANNAKIGIIKQKDVGFVDNKIEFVFEKDEKMLAESEAVYGGAIYVADGGQIDTIEADFIGNKVTNSGTKVTKVEGTVEDGEITGWKTTRHAKGGAIYLADGGEIKIIGNENTKYIGNEAVGTGDVRGGALFVSAGKVTEIHGDFIRNKAMNVGEGDLAHLQTYGGAMRFDQSTIFSLDANFIQNETNGSGGALSLTSPLKDQEGTVIYQVIGDFKGNTASVNGGAVDNLGQIGVRGYVETTDGEALKEDFSNAGEGTVTLKRDSTEWAFIQTHPNTRYNNKQNRAEYDGSFTGGFINSNFLYNQVIRADALKTDESGNYFRGAGIYTDKDLFITVNNRQEVYMSGNQIRNDDGKPGTRSAIYVDNLGHEATFDESTLDYKSIVVYLVAKNDSILRIDDVIRGHEESKYGVALRLRGYADKVHEFNSTTGTYRDTTGLIVLNNRVENTYTVMDDVTLYIGYKPRTYYDKDYFEKYGSEEVTYKNMLVGDEEYPELVGPKGESVYLDQLVETTRNGEKIQRSATEEYLQSDVFRDSHVSVRSGIVSLLETTYATKSGNKVPQKPDGSEDLGFMSKDEVYTEYVIGSLIAYGADYNYGLYGTADVDETLSVKKEYLGEDLVGSGMKEPSDDANYRVGQGGRFATFEFGIDFESDHMYTLVPNGQHYYWDMNENATQNGAYTDADGSHGYADSLEGGDKVPVERLMAKSDVLTVFAVWKDGQVDWENSSKGRVTLHGLSVKAPEDGWKYGIKRSVSGPQPQPGEKADGFNRDVYVQLINYMLVDEKGNLVKDADQLAKFHAMFDEEEDEKTIENGYHLLRLSDHLNPMHNATAYMNGSDILADEIELATTVTRDDTLHIVGWRDHLAEWAEHEGSWDENSTNEDGSVKETAGMYDGKKHFLLDQSVYYLNRDINLVPNPTEEDHSATGAEMWGKYLTVEGTAKWRTLDLQHKNMLSLIIENQQVRLQSFTLENVQDDLMENKGDLIFDTMKMYEALTVNNAGNAQVENHLANQLTVTGRMDIDFTITTKGDYKGGEITATLGDGEKLTWRETQQHGSLIFDHSTKVTTTAANEQQSDVATAAESMVLNESVVRILGTVEHQDITHRGEDELKLTSDKKTYDNNMEGTKQTLPTWSIEGFEVDADGVRDSFKTNTYLDTTVSEGPGKKGETATSQFKAFRDNSLTMEGGAFNLGTMWKHRLQLRSFDVKGGAVFVESSTIDMGAEVMGGIDACDDEGDHSDYKGNGNAGIKHDNGTAEGLIWLGNFELKGTSNKEIVHVKFVDDGVGDAVKDGMGIANGAAKSGMRIMSDGDLVYDWEVTYNDEEAVNSNDKYAKDKVGVRGMYTFRRRGFTPEAKANPVSQLTGSYMTMMQVYNYGFQHADMFADSVADAQRESLYEQSYTVVNPTKGKNAVPGKTPDRPCVDKNSLRSGLWFNTFTSTEKMPLHNGPDVRMETYGGFVGGDSSLHQHSNGWASVWSLYGGYVGSTQRYDGVRIRQNGAAIGATGTFYKKQFFTALTASVGMADARATGRGGNETFHPLMGGIASRSGYNFTLDNGRYILQPNLMLSMSFFDTPSYKSATGADITSSLTPVFQVNPSVKLIRKTDCVWKPYASVGAVFNFMGNTHSKIDGAELPSMSINPYVEYSVGVQRSLGESYTIFGQATGRNGGRNGAELNVGLRYAW